jgi:hypothetical protein
MGTGHSSGGAESPAGSPVSVATANQAEYVHSASNPHPEQLGQVLAFGGVSVTNTAPTGFTKTGSDGGGAVPEGFEITGGVWVDDSNVYYDCIKPLDGGVNGLSLPNGVKGVWDRYQDYYAGTAQNPAPIVPVLVPLTCSDLQ